MDPDVGRFDVAMNDPTLVSCCQSQSNFLTESEYFISFEFAAGTKRIFERLALQQFHGHEGNTTFDTNLEDHCHIVVVDRRHGSGFFDKTLATGRCSSQFGFH